MASTSSPAIHSEIVEITNAFDGTASPSASSSTSPILFDVYINHHRTDDRLTLATAIYNFLDLIGLKAYLNSDELELGDFLPRAVEQAMRNACLHIAIFSHDYAQSPWCLEELSIMLKSLTPIIPVFYGVQPSDLRYVSQRKGMYAEAFLEHQKKGRYSLEKIEEWKIALHNVSFYWGEIVNDSAEEQMALKNIVKHIVKIIRTVPLEMEKQSVGLQEAVVGTEMLTSSTPLQKLRRKMMPYDVCINHHGPDVKDTLAIAIYNALGYMEYRVFLDKEEFQLGDFFPAAIHEALSSASVYIPIFSPGYAQSSWCLEELSFMVKTEKCIIPVFYHVQPADLINIGQGKGMYAKKFLEHQERGRYSSEKLEEWMRALYKVSSINGYMIDDNDEEQRVLKSIVDNVLINLRKLPLEVAMHPVGLDQAILDFEMSLRESVRSHSRVQIVGIYGKGGSGKTTLAKAIYNWKQKCVVRSSFIFNVRDAARKRLLVEKQKTLLKDLRFKSLTFDNEEEGRHILQSHLRSLSVLIVLDDVGDTDQLDTLLPEPESLGIGSLVIVTTRDSNVLKEWGISVIYRMRALNVTNATELFSWHAFKQPCPLPGFEVLVENFIVASDRLPLPLVIAGGQLYGRYDKDYWQVQFHKFSYDALNEEEKQMFLDTACFFIGEESSLAIAVWDGSVWSGMHGWESLISKHLVYLDENNRIRMRDDLRDFGREIADQQSPYRLWSPWQFNQIQPLQKHIEIRGMINVTGDNCYSSKGKIIINQGQGFPGLPPASLGLKLFACSGEFLNQEVGELSRELLWLRWNDFDHTNLPPWLSLKNLRVLELNGALNLQELWTDDAHAPLQLRELIITSTWSASFERFPSSISNLKHLRKITLLGFVGKEFGIKRLPEEFCDLQSLEHLELRHCARLLSLPSRFGDLKNLRHLDLCSCKALRMLPVSFQQLTYLKYLDLSGCKRLTFQNGILENIAKLEILYLSGCRSLQKLPRQIIDQGYLRELQLQHTSLKDLPSKIGQLSKLEWLTIGSPLLKSLPDSLGNLSRLKRLSIINCFALKSLPRTLGHLELLDCLCIEATGVRSLPEGFRQLTNLQTLKISDCPLNKLDFGSVSSSSLEKLTEINISETPMTRISISQECCPRLQILRLSKNDKLEVIETLPATVKDIELSECETLKNIMGILAIPIPPKLTISDCPKELEKLSKKLI